MELNEIRRFHLTPLIIWDLCHSPFFYGKMVIICQFENFLCIFANICYTIIRWLNADLAQLAEHVISNDEVGGSNPLVSIIKTYRVY